MGSKLPHRIFIILGITSIVFAGFLPIGYSVIDIKGENNFADFITKPSFGITHSVYYLNFILLTIPLICGYHGRRFVAQLLVVLFIVFAVITTFIGCTFIGFNWGGPIHGNIGLGMSAMIAGDIFLLIGCLLQIAYNKKQIED